MASVEVIRTCDAGEVEEWDRAVESAGGGLLLSRTAWVEILASSLQVPWSLHLCRLGDELAGGALVLEGGGRGGRSSRSPHPFFSLHVFFRGEVSSTKRIPQGVEVLSAIARGIAGEPGLIFGYTPPSLLDLRALSWAGWRVEPRYGFRLSLPRGGEAGPLVAEADPGGPGDPTARLAVDRGIGSACAVRCGAGAAARILLLHDERRLYALPSALPLQASSPRDGVEAALSLAFLPEAEGKDEILFFGDAWEEWFGCEAVEPLGFVPVGRARPPGGLR